ncbi:MAG: asparagine synthase (glutamine-hydrolyzing) [Ferruginibacter sp.]
MCGFAGIVSLVPAAKIASPQELMHLLTKMSDTLIHRGPDGLGYWINANTTIGLGHRRLSIIDLTDAAAQPMHYLNRYTLVYNGEIYNYPEIRDILAAKGYHFHSKSDTEIVLAAYDCWKEDCLQYFDGMFAFAIWDREEEVLFAARDRFGEKPFYFAADNESLVFASEMKALWAIGVEKTADEKMLLNYLSLGYVQNANDKKQTFFKNIYSLPPAHYMLLNQKEGDYHLFSYWEIDKEKYNESSADEAAEKFFALLNDSVYKRLRSDVSIGASLSGGIDSSVIAALISKAKPNETLSTFSAVFNGFEKDESKYIEKVKDHLYLKNFMVSPNEQGLIDEFEKMAYYQEEPFPSSSIYAQYKVFELAAQNGIKVLLDGQGADEMLAGYHKYIHWYLQQLIGRKKFGLLKNERKAFADKGIEYRWGKGNYLATLFPAQVAIQLERNEYNRIVNHPDLHPDFLLQMRGREWEGIHKPIITKLNDILHFNTITHGLEELLRFADRNSMAHGREVRLPYLSHELVEFVFALPANLKIHEGFTKWIMRKAVNGLLPNEITWRTDKVGYEPPQKKWMENPMLRDYMHEAKKKLVNKGILKTSTLNSAIQPKAAHEAGNFDWRYLCAAQIV